MRWLAGIAVLIAVHLVRVTTLDGLPVDINVDDIVAMRPPRPSDQRVTHGSVNCLVFTSDGKFYGVIESCPEVGKRMKDAQE